MLIDGLAEIGVCSIKVTGGEPFTRHDIIEILKYMEEKDLNFIIFTNGTLIDEKIIKELRNFRRLLKVRVSIDGNERTNDAIRGKGSYRKAMATVESLCKNDIPCEINYTITASNYMQIAEVAEYIEKNSIPCKINIGIVKIAGRANNSSEEYYFNKENIQFVSEEIKRQILNHSVIQPFYLLEPIYYKIFGKMYGCPAARLTSTIKYNGDVFACGLFSAFDEMRCGNVKRDGFLKIWNDDLMEKIRNLPEREECCSCDFYKNTCTGACRGNALNYFNELNAEDINCYVYKLNFNCE